MAGQQHKATDVNMVRPQVIVRAWGDEPVALRLYSIDTTRDRALVGKDGTPRPISLPMDHVFKFDEGVFTRLRDEFQSGRTEALEKLYADTCIKYRNSLY